MKITFLGTGNAAGVPVYGCTCLACHQAQGKPLLQRQPSCLLLEQGSLRILVDAGLADLPQRYQPGVGALSHIFLTHYHIDHVLGLFSMRWGEDSSIPVIGLNDPRGCDDLFKHPGIFDFSYKAEPFQNFVLEKTKITPLPLIHSRLTMGYFFKIGSLSLAYLSDTAGLPADTEKFLRSHPPTIMIIDCEMPPQTKTPRNHNDVLTTLALHRSINPGQTILTHISHQLDNWLKENELPKNITAAFDNMELEFT